jgi:hypothetical protein
VEAPWWAGSLTQHGGAWWLAAIDGAALAALPLRVRVGFMHAAEVIILPRKSRVAVSLYALGSSTDVVVLGLVTRRPCFRLSHRVVSATSRINYAISLDGAAVVLFLGHTELVVRLMSNAQLLGL